MRRRIVHVFLYSFSFILLSSCGAKIPFPPNDIAVPSLAIVEDVEVSEFPVNLYLQSTKYMEGFVRNNTKQNLFTSMIPMLLASAKQLDNAPSCYRFDCLSLVEINGSFPYKIDEVRFSVDSVKDTAFYSIPWYFGEPKGERYQQLYPDDNMNYESYYKENYLAETLSSLNPNELSVVITDMIDYKFITSEENYVNPESSTITSELRKMVNNPSSTVSIFAVKSQFDGVVYTDSQLPREASNYNGIRPFYIIVYGDTDQNLRYCELVQQELNVLKDTSDDEMANWLFFTTGTSVYKDTALASDITDEPSITGLQEVYPSNINDDERMNIQYDENTTFYYDIKKDGDALFEIEFPMNLPFDLVLDKEPNFRLRKVTGINDGSQEGYTYEDIPSDGLVSGSVVENSDTSTGNLSLSFDQDRLSTEGSNLGRQYKYQLLVEATASKYVGETVSNIDDLSIGLASAQTLEHFGTTTVNLSEALSPIVQNSDSESEQLVAFFVLYLNLPR